MIPSNSMPHDFEARDVLRTSPKQGIEFILVRALLPTRRQGYLPWIGVRGQNDLAQGGAG
jgi:hypothetical protein